MMSHIYGGGLNMQTIDNQCITESTEWIFSFSLVLQLERYANADRHCGAPNMNIWLHACCIHSIPDWASKCPISMD
jgi:hypothetical protein